MSIDARIETVIHNEDGSGILKLVDRPKRHATDHPGCRGQTSLAFDSAPHDVTALNGRDIWGGSSTIMLGDTKIADRIGYARIRFTVESIRDAFATCHA